MPELGLTRKEEKELVLKTLLNTPLITIIASVLTTFLIATFFLKVGGPVPVSVTQTTLEKTSAFDVAGEGRAWVIPNQARVNFGITTSASTVIQAQEQANEAINLFKKDLKQIGIDEENIKTVSYTINPDYDFREGRSRVIGYNANVVLEVLFQEFEKLNQAFTLATRNGINNIGQLIFELSQEEQEKAEDKARKMAIDKAKDKARKMAKESGIRLGKIINIQETTAAEPPVIRPFGAVVEEKEEAVEVSAGTSEVKIQVKLSFETL